MITLDAENALKSALIIWIYPFFLKKMLPYGKTKNEFLNNKA